MADKPEKLDLPEPEPKENAPSKDPLAKMRSKGTSRAEQRRRQAVRKAKVISLQRVPKRQFFRVRPENGSEPIHLDCIEFQNKIFGVTEDASYMFRPGEVKPYEFRLAWLAGAMNPCIVAYKVFPPEVSWFSWYDSMRSCLEEAEHGHIIVESDQVNGLYYFDVPESENLAAKDYDWPGDPLVELVHKAIEKAVIDSEEHHVIRAMRGDL